MTTCLEPAATRARNLPRRTASELRALAEDGARRLEEAGAAEVLRWAAETFGARLAVTSSMTDAVVAHLSSVARPGVDVLFLDTGYHFGQTIDTRNAVAARLAVRVVDVRPAQSVVEQDTTYGPRLFARDPAACCALRKVAPLRDALKPYDAWVTGVRRADGPTRRTARAIAWDSARGLVKINPIVGWSDAEVERYAAEHDLPTNALVAEGYPSIGCWPCTRPVAEGTDLRSGRWAGTDKTECGLHA